MFPLTASQKAMYDTHCFYKDTGICNVGGYFFFKDAVDLSTLEQAMQKVIEQSDGLRIRIHIEQNVPVQSFKDYSPEKIEVLELSADACLPTLEAEMRIPFDLSGRLYVFKILVSGNKTGVFVKLHHLVSDAWSAALVCSRIIQAYYGLNQDEESFSYLDFIRNEQDYLSSKKYSKDSEYWASKYEQMPSVVSLSPGKSVDFDVTARRNAFDVPADLTQKIRAFCAENALSPAIVFEAAVALYAARINQCNDVTLCSMVVNRNGYEEKNTVGMFNSILPLTVQFDEQDGFLALCKKISAEHFQLFRHQKYPLESILQQISGGKPVYDIMVSYQNIEYGSEYITEPQWIFNGTSDLGYMLNISDREQHIHLDVDWRVGLYTEAEIVCIHDRLMCILEQCLSDAQNAIESVEIIMSEEKAQLLFTFNDTKTPYDQTSCIHHFLERNADKTPDKIALRFMQQSMSYAELNRKANALAHRILETTKGKNAVVAIMLERSFEMLIAIYAVLKAGCAYMPIDPHFPHERIGFMLEDSDAEIVLSDTKWNRNTWDRQFISVADFAFDSYSSENPQTNVTSQDTAYVIYTSGSTGKPKGAMIAHHSAVNRIQWMHKSYPLLPQDVILQKTPYTFDVSVWELFWWSMAGGALQILVPEGHKDPAEIIEAVQAGAVTHMHFVPSMLNAFLDYVAANPKSVSALSSLKYVFASGEALQPNHVRKFYDLLGRNGTTLHNLYGPTECTVDVSYYDCVPDSIPDSIPIGKPIDNTQLLILDKHQRLLPVGIVGELYISGVGVGQGYLNREELTTEKFIPNPYGSYPTLYKTGDLAKWQTDGNIDYCGRTDFQIKIRGLRVELGDIENAVSQYPAVQQVLVTVITVHTEQALCAYFTAIQPVDTTALRAWLKQRLPDYMVPQYFVQLDAFPVTDNGKIDRKTLPKPILVQTTQEYIAPKTALETLLQTCAAQALEMREVSCEADLFALGLTSLGVIQMITDLSEQGYDCKVKDVYAQKTITGIAQSMIAEDTEDDYEEDRLFYADISDIADHALPLKESDAILITGASGFLGIHLIRELMATTEKKLYCLVRSEDKLKRALQRYTEIPYPNPRIVCVQGDITLPDLGIEPATAASLKAEIGDLIHSAADVSFFCAWEQAKRINYTGTCNALRFAEEAGAKLHHISTMSVSGDILTSQTVPRPSFSEDDLFIGQRYRENVYTHSKYLAEKEIVKAIREDRVNAAIYRIANLTWRVSDGMFLENPEKNDLYILTSVMKKIRFVPTEVAEESIELTPVDDCAWVICILMQRAENRVYHLKDTESPSVYDYMQGIAPVELLPMSEFYARMQNVDDPHIQFCKMYIQFLSEDPDKSLVSICGEKTNALLWNKWNNLGKKYSILFHG